MTFSAIGEIIRRIEGIDDGANDRSNDTACPSNELCNSLGSAPISRASWSFESSLEHQTLAVSATVARARPHPFAESSDEFVHVPEIS